MWRNAGFNALRSVRELNEYEPRYDPTVVPSYFGDGEGSVTGNSISLDKGAYGSHPPGDRHYSIADYHEAFKSGRLTPISVARTIVDLVSQQSKYHTILIDIRKEPLLIAAEASTKRFKEGKPLGILDGVPVAVKDEVDLSGCKKTLGSANDFTRADGQTSWCVRKWEEAGAVILGKLNMHEIGLGELLLPFGKILQLLYLISHLDTTNNNTVHGMPPNPHSTNHYPGGSSGGSASAVSLGLVPLALGADGGGSIRIPSSYCAITGLKPSHGRISISPTLSLAPTVGVVGPMATNVADTAIGYKFMAAPDPLCRSSASFPAPLTGKPSLQKVIGVCDPWFARADASVLTLCQRALDNYKAAGWTIVPITIPLLPLGQTAHAMTILSEISASASSIPTASPRSPSPAFSAANRILLSVARQTPAHDFLLAQKLRNLLMQHLSFLFQENPGMVIVTPTTPNAGWRIENGQVELKGGISDADKSVRSMEYVWLANFSGCPAISVPVGFTKEEVSNGKEVDGTANFPVGLMGMGEWGNEVGLLEWAIEAEKFIQAEGEGDRRPKGEWVDVFKLAEGRFGKGD